MDSVLFHLDFMMDLLPFGLGSLKFIFEGSFCENLNELRLTKIGVSSDNGAADVEDESVVWKSLI